MLHSTPKLVWSFLLFLTFSGILKSVDAAKMQFDFDAVVDWSDDDWSPFDEDSSQECDYSVSSSCYDEDPISLESSSVSSFGGEERTIKVRFAEEDEVFEVIHINDYTEEEIPATWYRPQEFREMREQAQRTVFMMDNTQVEETDTMTTRGLEFRSSAGSQKRSQHKRESYAAVMMEQERQWITQRDDPDRIAAFYQAVSSKCQGLACLQGIQDEQDIQEYLRSPFITVPDTSPPPASTTTESIPFITPPSSTSTTTESIPSTSPSSDEYLDQPSIISFFERIPSNTAPPDGDKLPSIISFFDPPSLKYSGGTFITTTTNCGVDSINPVKPYETQLSARRLAVLEDIKILSGAPEIEHWQTNPAAA